jgi:hypothetical protein
MELGKRQPSGREKNAAFVALLAQLRDRLHSKDISTARKAAFNLSWMQEDGLDILVEALFGNFPRTAKKAAAYGLRRMNGRMKKVATEVLARGLTNENRITQEACATSLKLMSLSPSARKIGFGKKPRPRRPEIREYRGKPRPRSESHSRKPPADR